MLARSGQQGFASMAGRGSPWLITGQAGGSPIRMSPVTLSPMAAAKLSISGQPVWDFPPSASWPWEPLAACQSWGLSYESCTYPVACSITPERRFVR